MTEETRIAKMDGSENIDGKLSNMIDGIQALMNGINTQSEQMGVLNKRVGVIDEKVNGVIVKMDDFDDRVVHLEEDQFVDLVKADNIKYAAHRRAAELLEIEFDERGGAADGSEDDYVNYFSKFVGRIHVDARHAGLEGPRMYATPRKNYQALINFIAEWVPSRGVEGLKAYYDGLAAARRKKQSK